MSERQEERLEPSLEREGAGGRLRSALPLATEGTQETLLMKKGLGMMEDRRASPCKKSS